MSSAEVVDAKIQIVSNISGSHHDVVADLIQQAYDQLIIASPFLSRSMSQFLDDFDFRQVRRFDLITTITPQSLEQLAKPFVLREFFEYFEGATTKFRLHINNALHGKVYIGRNSTLERVLVSSANFTRNGLKNNHEWGTLITNSAAEIESVQEELLGAIEYAEVTFHQVKRACLFAEVYRNEHPEWSQTPEIFSDILDQVYSDDSEEHEAQYFLKPIGTSENPVLLEDRRDFSDLHQNLHFSKKKPSGVKKGDVVITTAVGPGSLLGYFRVTGGLERVTEEEMTRDPALERWPWYMEGRNQVPGFSAAWWSHDLKRQDLLAEYKANFPERPITQAGGYTLNTLNRGNDKVRITKEFGEFLIKSIEDAATSG